MTNTLKRVTAMVLAALMTFGILFPTPIKANTASAVQEKIDSIRAVYPTGSYFTSTGSAHKAGGPDCPDVCMICSINGIPARGNLPSGKSMGYSDGNYQCFAFALYASTYIFGGYFRDWGTVSLSNASLGDVIVFDWDGNGSPDHYAIFLYSSGSSVVVYDANYDYYCGVRYGSSYSAGSVTTVYHAPNYESLHTHKYTSSVTKEPTCTATGVRTYSCSCGASYTESISAAGHQWNEGEIITAAGCESEGIMKYTCTVCGVTYSSAISSTGHTLVNDEATAATCDTAGLTAGSHCSVCDAVIQPQETVPALGHDYCLSNTAASCQTVTVTYSCSRCQDSYDDVTYEYVWSDWSETRPEGIPEENIESKTQYRYSEKTTTQSSSPSLSGWTQYDEQITGWGSWSSWQNSAVSSSDSREVKTQYIAPTYKTVWHYSRSVSSDGKLSSYGTSYYPNSQSITLDYRLSQKGTVDGQYHYGSYDGGYGTYLQNYWWNERSESVVDRAGYTQYSYRDAIYTYYFYQWSEMSTWQDEAINEDDSTKVETRTAYRYKINPTGHTPVKDEGVEATCLTTGLTEGSHCSVCEGTIQSRKLIPALGHAYENGKCVRCGDIDPSASVNPEHSYDAYINGVGFNVGDKAKLTVFLATEDTGMIHVCPCVWFYEINGDALEPFHFSYTLSKGTTLTPSKSAPVWDDERGISYGRWDWLMGEVDDISGGAPIIQYELLIEKEGKYKIVVSDGENESQNNYKYNQALSVKVENLSSHKISDNWMYDSKQHWHKCDSCSAQENLGSHEYDGDQDTDCSICGYVREITPPVPDNAPQIVAECKKALAGKEFTVSVTIKNNPGFTYLELTPTYSRELSLIRVENGELISDLTQGRQYVWVADNDVYDDGILMTFTFTTSDNVDPGNYEVGFIMRGCVNYDEQNVGISVVNGVIEIVDFTYGDANSDGVINGQDIVRMKKYFANYDYNTETSTIEINAGADANGDGVINGQDVVRLKKYLANYDYETDSSTIVLGPKS